MKLIDRLLGRKDTAYSSATLASLLAAVMGGGATKSGATVTRESALQVSVVLCCVRAIAEGVAQVPWLVMQESRTAAGKVTRVAQRNHPLFDLLHRKPNRWQTSFAFRETLLLHILLGPTGAAYAFRSRSSDGRTIELVLMDPHRVKETVSAVGEVSYTVRGASGEQRQLGESDVWRIAGPSWTGTEALPLIRLAREAIGLAAAVEETQAQLHANGVRASGTYSVDGALSPKQYDELKGWIAKEFSGITKAGAPFILDRGAKWTPLSMTSVDAQHLETRRHHVEVRPDRLAGSVLPQHRRHAARPLPRGQALAEGAGRHDLVIGVDVAEDAAVAGEEAGIVDGLDLEGAVDVLEFHAGLTGRCRCRWCRWKPR